jgi:hypothetical protein
MNLRNARPQDDDIPEDLIIEPARGRGVAASGEPFR